MNIQCVKERLMKLWAILWRASVLMLFTNGLDFFKIGDSTVRSLSLFRFLTCTVVPNLACILAISCTDTRGFLVLANFACTEAFNNFCYKTHTDVIIIINITTSVLYSAHLSQFIQERSQPNLVQTMWSAVKIICRRDREQSPEDQMVLVIRVFDHKSAKVQWFNDVGWWAKKLTFANDGCNTWWRTELWIRINT